MAHAYDHERRGEGDHAAERRPRTTVVAGSAVPNIVRLLLSLLGAAGMIIGALLQWVADRVGTSLPVSVFYRTSFSNRAAFLASAGAVMILLGLVAVLGIAMWGGWLTRIAGALGIVGFVLVLISMSRTRGLSLPGDIGLGLWVVVAGSILTLIGGFFAARPIVVREPRR